MKMKMTVSLAFSILALACVLVAGTALASISQHWLDPGGFNEDRCGQCHNLHGGSQTQLLQAGATGTESLCLSCHNGIIANAVDVHANSTARFNSFRATCSDCHSSHEHRYNWRNPGVSVNIKMVGRNAGDALPLHAPFGYAYALANLVTNTPGNAVANVVFESRGTDELESFNYSFADNDQDGTGDGTYDGICEVCHTATKYHRNNSSADHSHNTGTTCTKCHAHDKQFKGEGACVDCHASGVGSAPDVYRQITGGLGGDFYTQTSRHVFNTTGSAPLNFDCIVCHAEGDINSLADSILTTNEHNATGNTIAMRNVDSYGNPGVEGVDFWLWPAQAGVLNNTHYANMDMFCLSCHDSDGASKAAVNSTTYTSVTNTPTTAEAQKPFSNVDFLDQGGNAGSVTPGADLTVFQPNSAACIANGLTWSGSACTDKRSRVLDVKSQFYNGTGGSGAGYNGNPAQHAVIGARYSTKDGTDALCDITQTSNKCTAASTCATDCSGTWDATYSVCVGPQTTRATCQTYSAKALWTSLGGGWGGETWDQSYRLKGSGLYIASERETSTLHCADCHTVDTNAHSGGNLFMLTGTGTIDSHCWTCHDSAVYNDAAKTGSRFSHDDDPNVWDAGVGSKLDTNTSGAYCLNCHGGAPYDGYGGIHGLGSGDDWRLLNGNDVPSNGSNQERYRFIGGSYMSASSTFTDTTDLGCYVYFKNERWSNCTQHGSDTTPGAEAGTRTPNYGRALKY